MKPIATSSIQARTFTPIYSQSEDRIRLIANYADYSQRVDLWLTRAFLLKLIPTIEDYLDQYDAGEQNAPEQQQSERAAQSKTDMPTLSMTEKAGYLVQSVDVTYDKRKRYFKLVFKTEAVQVETVLKAPMLRALLKSVFAAIPKIDWGISPQWMR
jgi:hypothetical protein